MCPRHRMRIASATGILLVAGLAGSAFAAPPTLLRTMTVQSGNGGLLPQFDPAKGTLRSVKLHFASSFAVKITISGAKGETIAYQMSAPVTYLVSPSVPPYKAAISASGNFKASAGGTSFVTNISGEETRPDAATLAVFRGKGTVAVVGKWSADKPDTLQLDQGAKLVSYKMEYSSAPSYTATYTYLPRIPIGPFSK